MADRTPAVWDASHAASPSHYPPSQTALILADYQNMVFGMLGPDLTEAVVPVATALHDWATQRGLLTIHSLIDGASTPAETSKLAFRWSALAGAFAAKPELGDEHAALAAAGQVEMVLTDRRRPGLVSAISTEAVRRVLRERGIKSLIVAGISSSGVVLSTVRAAAEEGFAVTVVSDACADRKEEAPRLIMDDVLPMTAHVGAWEEVRGELERSWGVKD